MVLGAFLIAVIVVVFLWRHVSTYQLLFWLSLIFLSAVVRGLGFRYYQRHQHDDRLQFWGRLFYLSAFMAGCFWSLLPILFYTQIAPEYLLLISTMFAGMVSVTAAAGSIYLPSFYAFALPLVMPMCFLHILSGVDYLAITGVMLLLYLFVNSLLAHRGHRQYIELVKARFANVDLMDQLNEEKLTAEKAVEVKNQFMASASHDLRQPLHALGMFIGSLRKRETDAERLDIIRDMEASTTSLSQLLHSMLDLSKLQADMVSVEPRSVALGPIFSNLKAEFEPLANAKSLDLQIPDSNIVVLTDPMLLERILRNLLANAIKFTESGQVSMQVMSSTPPYCKISVADSGCGINSSKHDAVFEDYVQLPHAVGKESGGLGLGLSIVRRYCELLDIPLELCSEPNRGSDFVLTLTMTEAPIKPCEALVDPLPDSTSADVLVIDDEKNVASAMRNLLSDWGCRVIVADSAGSALVELALRDCVPDLVLCDYRLSDGETGLDVIHALREGVLDTLPAIIVTADTSPALLREMANQGVNVLHKPLSEVDLKRAVASYLH